MRDDTQGLLFSKPDAPMAPAPGPSEAIEGNAPWKILIIDDDPDVHPLTRLVFKEFCFEGRGLEFISGYSGAEALALLGQHSDAAVMLLDVVMESDDAGLIVARRTREELGNAFVRIILRTGQPGYAPEAQVIAEYDINDYKEKSTLSSQSLTTSLTACLRAFRDIRTIENTRLGLQKIIQATGNLFEFRSLGQLATGILTQLAALISHEESAASTNPAACFAATTKRGALNIYAAFGAYEAHIGQPVASAAPPEVMGLVRQAMEERRSLFSGPDYLGFFLTKGGLENLIYLRGGRILKKSDQDLISIFSLNIAAAFENLLLNREVINTQKDVTFTLGEVIEARSGEAGQHVRRVAESSRLLAQLAGLPERDVELIGLASPMHDLGKIGIPDAILKKPGKLTEEEWAVMQNHTRIGCKVLENNDQVIIRNGAIICAQHHEKWDGSGYPDGLRGERIHIFARITSLIDVYDALSHPRVYKAAWSLEEVVDFIRAERGKSFDPALVDIFLDNLDAFIEIREAYAG